MYILYIHSITFKLFEPHHVAPPHELCPYTSSNYDCVYKQDNLETPSFPSSPPYLYVPHE